MEVETAAGRRAYSRAGMSDAKVAAVLVVLTLVFMAIGTAMISVASSQQGTIRTQQSQIQSLQSKVSSSTGSQSGNGTSGPFKLTLLIAGAAQWNSTATAPKYWVLTPDGLKSSANITLPAHTLIQLTIVDYDTASPLPSEYGQVSGTVGNVVYVVNGTAALSNFTQASATAVSSLNPQTQIGHTFTIPQLGINIPVAANSVEMADFYINQTGTFVWHCEDPCGYGPSGWLGPMSANGWMGGSITVS
ncbi:MAG: hypothetical protein JRN21_02820 [Nitrososphaerota archaeon]|nr:hypothetical protein [Nitrososphaerota archaeon]